MARIFKSAAVIYPRGHLFCGNRARSAFLPSWTSSAFGAPRGGGMEAARLHEEEVDRASANLADPIAAHVIAATAAASRRPLTQAAASCLRFHVMAIVRCWGGCARSFDR